MSFRSSFSLLVTGVFAFCLALTSNAYGQETSQTEPQVGMPQVGMPQEDMPQVDMPKLFNAYTQAYFQEKVYLHTDKDSYLAGETMWMRGYRTDASTLSPYYYSGLMYIEIRNPENQMMHRMQIIRTDSVFQATFKIPNGWPTGHYKLIAFTYWMQNFDDDFYFKKDFFVYNASDNNVVSKVTYTPNTEKNTIDVVMNLTNIDGEPYRGAVVDITPYANGVKQNQFTGVVDREGKMTFSLKDEDDITGLHIQFENDKPLKYEHLFKTPIMSDTIDVQFMPEGGHLLAGVPQQIGFKAIGTDGKGRHVKGEVRDSLGNKVGFFESQHLGMGRFAIQAQAGSSYFADVTTDEGVNYTFRLPDVQESGVGVSTVIRNGILTCRVQGTPDFDYNGLNLVIHSRGRVIRWLKLQAASAIQLPLKSLPEGLLHCFVVDQVGNVLSERLVLVNNDLSPEIKVDGLRSAYSRRQKVELDLNVIYGDSIPLPSDLSISVVDTKSTTKDKSENIVSYLTMSSDIKGKIENPAYYFDKSVPLSEREAKADLLMMTQAWKRFDVDSIFRGKAPNMPYSIEQGQYIAGKIKSLWSKKDVETGGLTLFGINQNPETKAVIFADVEADDTGFFQAAVSFPRNTTFILQGRQKGDKTNVEVELEEQKFERIKTDNLTGRSIYSPDQDATTNQMEDFYQSRGIRYFYNEKGERVYALEEAVVTARVGGDSQKAMYDDASDHRATGDALIEDGFSTLKDYLESVGLEVREDEETMEETIYIRQRPARIYVDGMWYSSKDILNIPIMEIEDVWVFRDPMTFSIVAMDAVNDSDRGGIIVHTKSGNGIAGRVRETTSFFRFTPLGYSVPAKFYSPKYDGTDDANMTSDDRVTVYWNPKVKTDMNGKAKVEFYTTDAFTEFLVTIEGIAGSQQMGIPIHKEFTIKSGM